MSDPQEPSLHDLWQRGEDAERRFWEAGDPGDLEATITVWEGILVRAGQTPELEGYRRAALTRLGTSRFHRYQIRGTLQDLSRAIISWSRALEAAEAAGKSLAGYLQNLASGVHLWSLQTGDAGALREAAALFERGLRAAAPDDPLFSSLRVGLANAWRALSERAESAELLDRALELLAPHEPPPGSPPRPSYLSALGLARLAQYGRTGAADDLEVALRALGEAATAPSSRLEGPVRWGNLGMALSHLYARTGNLHDLEAAVSCYEQALVGLPRSAPESSRFWNNLGLALIELYARTEAPTHLKAALRCFSGAAESLGADDPLLPLLLNNEAKALRSRFEKQGNPADLESALERLRRAEGLLAPEAPFAPILQANLTGVRLEWTRDPGALEEAVRQMRELLRRMPPGTPDHAALLHGLASQLRQEARGEMMVEEVRGLFRNAVSEGLAGAPQVALQAGREWGDWALERESWEEAAAAYTQAREALDLLLTMQLLRPSRGLWLRAAQALPAREACARMRNGDLTGAVLALEQGSARLLANALERDGARLAALRSVRPDLAARYESLSQELSTLAGGDVFAPLPPDPARISRRRSAQEELEGALTDIRRLEGYESFLLPPSWEEIRTALRLAAAEEATALVYLATSPAGSPVLIVREEGLASFDAGFTAADLLSFLEETRDGQPVGGYLPGIVLPGETAQEWRKTSLARLLPFLGRQIAEPLADRLRGRVARIVLIPVGPLALLPLHAAGNGLLLETFTISYAPNARSLAAALRTHRGRKGGPTFAGVGNPLPHPIPLRAAEAEVAAIASLFPAESARVLTGPAATRTEVFAGLTTESHLHFACHGFFDPEQPLASGLELGGGEVLALSDLLDGPARPAQARLAVLSACRSAVRDFHGLPDELIGLPAGFLEAEVPGVLGTLWPVDDLSTALLMVRFYSLYLAGDSQVPEAERGPISPAEALRRAQLWLRDLTAGQLAQYFAGPAAATDFFGRVHPRWPPAFAAEARLRFQLLEADEHPFADPSWWGGFLFLGA